MLHSHHHSNHLSALSSQGPLTPLICRIFLLLLFSASSSFLASLSFHPLTHVLSPSIFSSLFSTLLFSISLSLSISSFNGSPRLRFALPCLIYPILSPWLGGGELCNAQTLFVCMYVTIGVCARVCVHLLSWCDCVCVCVCSACLRVCVSM